MTWPRFFMGRPVVSLLLSSLEGHVITNLFISLWVAVSSYVWISCIILSLLCHKWHWHPAVLYIRCAAGGIVFRCCLLSKELMMIGWTNVELVDAISSDLSVASFAVVGKSSRLTCYSLIGFVSPWKPQVALTSCIAQRPLYRRWHCLPMWCLPSLELMMIGDSNVELADVISLVLPVTPVALVGESSRLTCCCLIGWMEFDIREILFWMQVFSNLYLGQSLFPVSAFCKTKHKHARYLRLRYIWETWFSVNPYWSQFPVLPASLWCI